MNPSRTRPLSLGSLRTFVAVAQQLSFGGAAAALGLSQPAVSRQIQALEAELGRALFVRGTRRVELAQAGELLLQHAAPLLDQLDRCVGEIRRRDARRQVAVSTFASFVTLWLLPRLDAFQREHPDIDLRLSAEDRLIELDDPDVDLVLRQGPTESMPAHAERLFGEVMTPVVSPQLLRHSRRADAPPLRQPADLAQHTLLEEDSGPSRRQDIGWRAWHRAHGLPEPAPRRWLYVNYTHQQVQAALAGQGVALGRLPLVQDAIDRGDLVEPFGARLRVPVAPAYWLIPLPGTRLRPELRAAMDWIRAQAAQTRAAIGQAAPAGSADAPTGAADDDGAGDGGPGRRGTAAAAARKRRGAAPMRPAHRGDARAGTPRRARAA